MIGLAIRGHRFFETVLFFPHQSSRFRFLEATGLCRAGCSKRPSNKAATSEEARRTLRYVEPLSDARTQLADFFSILLIAPTVFAMIPPCVESAPLTLSPASLKDWLVAWGSSPSCSKAACVGTGSPSSGSPLRRIPGPTRFATRNCISWSTTVSGYTNSRSSSRHCFTSSTTVTGGELLTDIVLRVGEIPSRVVVSSAATPAIEIDFAAFEALRAETLPHVSAIQDPDLRRQFTSVISRSLRSPILPEQGPSHVP